jgi:hypothetical protein
MWLHHTETVISTFKQQIAINNLEKKAEWSWATIGLVITKWCVDMMISQRSNNNHMTFVLNTAVAN